MEPIGKLVAKIASPPQQMTSSSVPVRSNEPEELTARLKPSEALEKAKLLTGQWANLKPDNPAVFVNAVAMVLAKYPPAVINKCCDPTQGLARQCQFFGLSELTEWLDREHRYFRLPWETTEYRRKTYIIPPAHHNADPISLADYYANGSRFKPRVALPAPKEPAA